MGASTPFGMLGVLTDSLVTERFEAATSAAMRDAAPTLLAEGPPHLAPVDVTKLPVVIFSTPVSGAGNCQADKSAVAKTKELKRRSWGQERIVFVSFGSRLPCSRLSFQRVQTGEPPSQAEVSLPSLARRLLTSAANIAIAHDTMRRRSCEDAAARRRRQWEARTRSWTPSSCAPSACSRTVVASCSTRCRVPALTSSTPRASPAGFEDAARAPCAATTWGREVRPIREAPPGRRNTTR